MLGESYRKDKIGFDIMDNNREFTKNKNKLSSDSLKDKLKEYNYKTQNSNLNNSDSFQIFNSYQDESKKNFNTIDQKYESKENFFEKNIKEENIIDNFNTNLSKNFSIPRSNDNMENIAEEDELGRFYENQQRQMEQALTKKNGSINNSRSKFKENTNNAKNLRISSSSSKNIKTINNPSNKNSGYKEIRKGNSNNSLDLREYISMNINGNKISSQEKDKISSNIYDLSARKNFVVYNNENSNTKINDEIRNKTSIDKGKSSLNRSHVTREKSASQNLRSPVEKKSPPNKEIEKKEIINRKQKKNLNSSNYNINNNSLIMSNKISYKDYQSSVVLKNSQSSQLKKDNFKIRKKSESVGDLKEINRNKISNDDKKKKLNSNDYSEKVIYKELNNNKENIHNIIKIKITNNTIEELKNIKKKPDFSNEKNLLDKSISPKDKKEMEYIKSKDFYTIQQSDKNFRNNEGNNFRKNLNLNNVNINTNLNKNNNLSLNSYKLRDKSPITPTISNIKKEDNPIKLGPFSNKNMEIKNREINNYSKIDNNKNSYTYLQDKNKQLEKKVQNNGKINIGYSSRLNNSVDNLKNMKIIPKKENCQSSNEKIKINFENKNKKDQILIDKILKENNINLSHSKEPDEKRCVTSNEKLNEFLSLNLYYDSIINKNNEEINNSKQFDLIENVKFDENDNKHLSEYLEQSRINDKNKLYSSNFSNNFQSSHNSYIMSMKNFNSDEMRNNSELKNEIKNLMEENTDLKKYFKDNELNNVVFSNYNSNEYNTNEQQINLKTPYIEDKVDLINGEIAKKKIENLTNFLRVNHSKKISTNTEKNALNNSKEENKQTTADKITHYQELYSKRKETLEKMNKSTQEKDKDFYEKNVEWKKKINDRDQVKKEEIDKERFKECHFTPKGVKRVVSKESMDNFYKKNMLWKQSVEKNKQTQNLIKERKEYEECFFKPTTNKKLFESKVGEGKEFKNNDNFYKKNLVWLDKMKLNRKNAELIYEEEIRNHNKEKIKIRDRLARSKSKNLINSNDNLNNSADQLSLLNHSNKSLNRKSIKLVDISSKSPSHKQKINRSFTVGKQRNKKLNDSQNQNEVNENHDVKLKRDLKELEILIHSLNEILEENSYIMNIPDNKIDFFVTNINNQSFAENEYTLNYNLYKNQEDNKNYSANKYSDYNKSQRYKIIETTKKNQNSERNYSDVYNEKYSILREKLKREKIQKLEEEKNI